MSGAPGFAASGFFALRTPLLPARLADAWGVPPRSAIAAKLEEDAKVGGAETGGDLAAAIDEDRAHARAALLAWLDDRVAREALFLASPDLDASLPAWRASPDSERGQRIERSLGRYFLRMSGRATPFGLFSCCTTGVLGDATQVRLSPRARSLRRTRLDMDFLFALCEALASDPEIRGAIPLHPNASLYALAGRLRYVSAATRGGRREHRLRSAEPSPHLVATLERARGGASLEALAAPLAADGVTLETARDFVHALVDAQLLDPRLGPVATGEDATVALAATLAAVPPARAVAQVLDAAHRELRTLDAAGPGVPVERYRALADSLSVLPAKPAPGRLVQVDLVRPADAATLGPAVVEETARAIEVLRRIGVARSDPLERFRREFDERYERREVPLLEALDEEAGIGFERTDDVHGEPSPWLDGLPFPGNGSDAGRTIPAALLTRLDRSLRGGGTPIALDDRDLDALSAKRPLELPDAFAAMVSVLAPSAAAVDRGAFSLLVSGVAGPSGARMLGRFCDADPALRAGVDAHLRAEERWRPDAVYAEIAHLPEGRIGNILARPLLRNYEIEYLGRSGAPAERVIPATDLTVSLRHGNVVLRSQRLGREVIPRLSSAHNFASRSLGVYRFLCALQGQGRAGALMWDWGALARMPFLPRVTRGRAVLARARWRLVPSELEPARHARGAARWRTVRAWREARGVPRRVLLAEADNLLPLDLDHPLAVELLLAAAHEGAEVRLLESLPGPDDHWVEGPEGVFASELIIPFVRVAEVRAPVEPSARSQRGSARACEAPCEVALVHGGAAREGGAPSAVVVAAPPPVRRRFAPGSAWLYAQLYTGPATADTLLRNGLWPLLRGLRERAAIQGWFFLRFADPQPHLRLRLRGDPARLWSDALSELHRAAEPWLGDGRLARLALNTYEREIERYGGEEAIAHVERAFEIDSEAALETIERYAGDAGLASRARLALAGVWRCFVSAGLGAEECLAAVRAARDGLVAEFEVDRPFRIALGDRFRAERSGLESLLAGKLPPGDPLADGLSILDRRDACWTEPMAALRALAARGRLTQPLDEVAGALAHMHVNRMLRTAHRAQELVIHDFLARLGEEAAARARSVSSRD